MGIYNFKINGKRTMSVLFHVYLFLPDESGQRKDQDSLSWLLGGWAKYLPIILGRVRYDPSQLRAASFSGS